MLTKVKMRACCALILAVLTLVLCACAASGNPAASSPAEPSAAAPTALHGCWIGSFDAGDELMRAFGVDLGPWLAEPLQAALRFELKEDGSCVLVIDYSPCEAILRPVIEALVRQLQAQESNEPLGGLALAEALGAAPSDLAAALCDELLPPDSTRSGRFFPDRAEIVWQDGGVSALRGEDASLWLTLPPWGELCFVPCGD